MFEWPGSVKLAYIVLVAALLFASRRFSRLNPESSIRRILDLVGVTAVAIGVVFIIIQPYVFQICCVVSSSMKPTLKIGDYVLVNKFTYIFSEPKNGNIIVFKSPPEASPEEPDEILIKRVIGRPGDTVWVSNGSVFRNGERLSEPYVSEPISYNVPQFQVPAGKLYVLGDNREESDDSHDWGLLSRDKVIGRAGIRVWSSGEGDTTR